MPLSSLLLKRLCRTRQGVYARGRFVGVYPSLARPRNLLCPSRHLSSSSFSDTITISSPPEASSCHNGAVKHVVNTDTYSNTTLRLLAQPSSWSRGDVALAHLNLNWWIEQDGGSTCAILLLQRIVKEEKETTTTNLVEEEEILLVPQYRIHALVEQWALDHYNSSPLETTSSLSPSSRGELQQQEEEAAAAAALEKQQELKQEHQQDSTTKRIEPAELVSLLHLYCARHKIRLDPSTLRLIHKVTESMNNKGSSTVTGVVNQLNLLSELEFVQRTGNAKAFGRYGDRVVDEILRLASYNSNSGIAIWAQKVLDTLWAIDKKWFSDGGKRLRLRPDYSIYLSVMRTWFNSNEPNKGIKMKELLDEMEDYSRTGMTGLFPGKNHFGLMMLEYAQTANGKAAVDLLRMMLSRHLPTRLPNYIPPRRMYIQCLDAVSQDSNKSGNWIRVETLAEVILDVYRRTHDKVFLPKDKFWFMYIDILSSAGVEEALICAENRLDRMVSDKGQLKPTVRYYGMILRGWGKLKRPDRAEALLLQMNQKYIAGKRHAKPDTRAFVDVIEAWTQSDDQQANYRVQHLTKLMNQTHDDDERGDLKNDENHGIGELMKQLSVLAEKGDANRAEQLLRDSIKQNEQGASDMKITTQHYSAVVKAWSTTRSEEALDRATSLFREMLNRYDSGDEDLRPTEHGYTSVISACARSRRPDGGERAQAVFDNMKKRFEAGEVSLKPTNISYSALINAWTTAGRPDLAESVLLQMHDDFLAGNDDAKPTVISFNTVLTAWSKHRSEQCLKRASQVLRLMQDLGESHLNLKPTSASFSCAIACCINSTSPWRVDLAENFFQEAKERYASGDKKCRPNCMMYGAMIQTICRSNLEDAAIRSDRYLQEMLALDDFDAYQILLSHNAVMGAWSRHTKNRVFALERVEDLVRNLIALSRSRRNRECLPNKYTYSQLLGALWKCDPPDKRERLEAAVKEMKKLGVETDKTVQHLVAKCSAGFKHVIGS